MATLRRSVIVSVLFIFFGGPGILLVLVPWWETRFRVPADEPWWQVLGSAVVIAAGLIPLMESAWRFVVVGRGTLVPAVPTEHLVVSGLYAHVRNPMYVGVLTVLAAEAALFRSSDLLIELAAVWIGIQIFVRFYEEPKLARTYREEYATYRRNVRRWLPRMRAWRGTAE
jgi:protein-S-isoprenylcysteine O-methyltransferase Ste14